MLLSAEQLSINFGSRQLLQDVDFYLNEGDKTGVIGINGTGKSTFLKVLAGLVQPDSGRISRRPNLQVSYLPQNPEMDDDRTILEQVFASMPPQFRALNEYEAKAMLTKLGLGETDRRIGTLSGGERRRAALCAALIHPADVLVLDEPTNHLDLRATEWLEEYLLHFKGTVLAISHDRFFLDRIAQRCIEINDGKAEFYSGGYSFYAVERQKRFEEKLRKYEKDQAKIEQLTRAAEQMHLWAFMGNDKLHKRAFSMEKRIAKLEQTERPTQAKKLTAKFSAESFNGDEVLVCEGVSKSFGEKKLFSNLSLKVTGRERISLIGDNGTGKSTLVKLIMQKELPDSGYLYLGPSVRPAYLPQIISFDHPERSLVDTMLYDCRCQPQEARDRLGAFGFRGEDVFTPVGALSGGEKSRLRLCMLMGSDINFLILDEPTNHLDIASREWMEDAVSQYPEALLFVSHDRYFIEKFATRIWYLENGKITDYRGSYSEFREYMARQQVFNQTAKQEVKKKESQPKKKSGSSEKQRLKLEREIAKLEEQLSELDKLAESYSTDYEKLMEIDSEKESLNDKLLEAYESWEVLAE